MFFKLLTLAVLALGMTRVTARGLRWQPPQPPRPSQDDLEGDYDFGPSWGANQPWGQPQPQPQPQPTTEEPAGWEYPDDTGDANDADADTGPATGQTILILPSTCNCPYTPQFNPVCGSDGNTYRNAGLLNCIRSCGTNVFQRRLGAC